MRIQFDEVGEKELPAFYGGEDALRARMFVDANNKILRGRLVPGASIGLHKHETSSEIILILSGEGTAVCDGVEEKLVAGDCHYCPKGSTHTLRNEKQENLIFFAVVPNQ